jgi:hypothetical protein
MLTAERDKSALKSGKSGSNLLSNVQISSNHSTMLQKTYKPVFFLACRLSSTIYQRTYLKILKLNMSVSNHVQNASPG